MQPEIFPDIEIEIPALYELTEIKNELQKTKTVLDALQHEVLTNKLWREALEHALVSYGIDLDHQQHQQQETSIKTIISSTSSSTFSTPIITSVQSSAPLANQNESILGIQESDLQTSNYQSQNDSPNDRMGDCSGLDLYPKRILIKQEIHNRLIEEEEGGRGEEEEEEEHVIDNIRSESTFNDLQNQSTSNQEKESEDMDMNVKSNLMSIIKENLQQQQQEQEELPNENPLQNSDLDPDSLLSSNSQLFTPSTEINLSDAVNAATALVHPQPNNHNNTNTNNHCYNNNSQVSKNSNANTISKKNASNNIGGTNLKQKRRRKRKTLRFTPLPKSSVIGRPRPRVKVPPPKSDPINYIDFLPGLVEHETLFRCKFCPFIKNDLNSTIRHVHIKHLQERKYSCPFCPQRFMLHGQLDSHISTHHADRMNGTRANVASTSYSSTSSSQSGQANHVEDNMQDLYHPYVDDEKRDAFLCVPCGIISYLEGSMIKHIHTKHSDLLHSKEATSTLPSFSSSSHSASTSQQTSFVCEHCLQKFISRPELELHKGQCRKTFLFHHQSTSNDLHRRTADRNEGGEEEEEEEDYVNCNININVDFPKQSRVTNTGFNRFAMNTVKKRKKIGGAGFWTFSEKMKEILDEHIQNVRSSKPPYGCKLCGAVLTTRQSARRHVMGKHKYVHEGKDV